jgi:zinc/manganese transport system permease protein
MSVRLTFGSLIVSAVIAVTCTWAGLFVSYRVPRIPPSFAIVATATGCYIAMATLAGSSRRLRNRRAALGSAN